MKNDIYEISLKNSMINVRKLLSKKSKVFFKKLFSISISLLFSSVIIIQSFYPVIALSNSNFSFSRQTRWSASTYPTLTQNISPTIEPIILTKDFSLDGASFEDDLFSDFEFKESSKSNHILDKWIISKLNLLIKNGTSYMDDYDTITFCKELIAFIEDLSTWYVRRSRDRFKDDDVKVKKQALETLSYVLLNLSKLIAPISPFISEIVYQDLRKQNKNLFESVHLDTWPVNSDKLIDLKLNSNMELTRSLVNKALDEREKVKIPIKQPLMTLKSNKNLFEKELPHKYLDLIKDEINVKEIEITKINSDMELDTKITDELLEEGISRELIRVINNFRKELNLTINDRVSLSLQTKDDLILNSLKKFKSEIMKSVQADRLEDKIDKNYKIKEVEVKSSKFSIKLKVL